MFGLEGEELPRCGQPRAASSKTRCELPPDHMVGRLPGPPVREHNHTGRDQAGRWHSWSPRCPRCGKALEVEPADGVTNTSDHNCLHCGYRETVRPSMADRITRSEVRQLAATARRLLLCPSCKGRRHRNCHASGCECPCKPRTQKGQS